MAQDPKPFECVLIFALPPIRPDVDSGGYVLNRGTIITLAREISRHAQDRNVKAIRLSIEPTGVAVSIASYRPREH